VVSDLVYLDGVCCLHEGATGADFEVTVPVDRDHESVVALVGCALVESTHEAVGAVFVSR